MSSLRGRMPAAGGGEGPGGMSGSSIELSAGETPFGAVATSMAPAGSRRGALGGPAPLARRRASVPAIVLLGRFSGSVPTLLNELKLGPAANRRARVRAGAMWACGHACQGAALGGCIDRGWVWVHTGLEVFVTDDEAAVERHHEVGRGAAILLRGHGLLGRRCTRRRRRWSRFAARSRGTAPRHSARAVGPRNALSTHRAT